MKYFIKRYPDGGFEFSPVGRVEVARDGFEIVDELPADVKAKMPRPGTEVNEIELLKKRVDEIEKKVK